MDRELKLLEGIEYSDQKDPAAWLPILGWPGASNFCTNAPCGRGFIKCVSIRANRAQYLSKLRGSKEKTRNWRISSQGGSGRPRRGAGTLTDRGAREAGHVARLHGSGMRRP